jgi:transcriptional regulator with XRE-family HTH domain
MTRPVSRRSAPVGSSSVPYSELGQYLMARRRATSPAAVGLPTGGHRRVPGLRREEVAALAGVNVDYYARLERGSETHPSSQTLSALARVFGLDDDARDHIHRLSGVEPALTRRHHAQAADVRLLALIDEWASTPALVLNGALDVLAYNSLGRALYRSFSSLENLAAAVFLDPQARRLYVDWESVAADTVATLRLAWGGSQAGDRPRVVVDSLRRGSPTFDALWQDHQVHTKGTGTKTFDDPAAGRFTLHVHTFHAPSGSASSDQMLVVYSADESARSREALHLLTMMATEVRGDVVRASSRSRTAL